MLNGRITSQLYGSTFSMVPQMVIASKLDGLLAREIKCFDWQVVGGWRIAIGGRQEWSCLPLPATDGPRLPAQGGRYEVGTSGVRFVAFAGANRRRTPPNHGSEVIFGIDDVMKFLHSRTSSQGRYMYLAELANPPTNRSGFIFFDRKGCPSHVKRSHTILLFGRTVMHRTPHLLILASHASEFRYVSVDLAAPTNEAMRSQWSQAFALTNKRRAVWQAPTGHCYGLPLVHRGGRR